MASAQLNIEIDNLDGIKGQMFIALYNNDADFLQEEKAIRREIVPINSLDFTFTFSDLPAGKYAVAVFQDVNGNNKLDTGLFGIPKEPYGFSNDASARFGPPDFEAAGFMIEKGSTTKIRISLR